MVNVVLPTDAGLGVTIAPPPESADSALTPGVSRPSDAAETTRSRDLEEAPRRSRESELRDDARPEAADARSDAADAAEP